MEKRWFKSKNKKKDLKSPFLVAQKIQQGGFYDGDLSGLAGIDITTGQITNEIKLTGEKKKKKSNTNKKDIVNELETLTNLLESGALNKEEFEAAKKKLLTN